MLYKVTPMMVAAESPKGSSDDTPSTKRSGEASAHTRRKKRKALVYDAEGHEVLITMMCLKCKQMRPLAMFGLRKMADGAIRNQPWCRGCRSGASTQAKREKKNSTSEPIADLAPPATTSSEGPSVATVHEASAH
jgi:hypothetical protein